MQKPLTGIHSGPCAQTFLITVFCIFSLFSFLHYACPSYFKMCIIMTKQDVWQSNG